jgi:hypothetical protein
MGTASCTGTMTVHSQKQEGTPSTDSIIEVDSSPLLTFKGLSGDGFLTVSSEDSYAFLTIPKTCGVISVSRDAGGNHIIMDDAKGDFYASLDTGLEEGSPQYGNVSVSGNASGRIEVVDTKTAEGVSVFGTTGPVTLELSDYSKDKETSFDVIGVTNPFHVRGLFDGITLEGAVRLPSKTYKVVKSLRARTVPDPSSILVYWAKVRGASGYVLYRQDRATGKYVRLATLPGKRNRAYIDGGLAPSTEYRYKVTPYKYKGGKKRSLKRSYWVSAATPGGATDNAASVALSRKKVGVKGVGDSFRLRATVKAAAGKVPVSSKVRWVSTDGKVVKVSKSGRIKAKAKGVAYVYAKAHDGINSARVKVRVR